MFYNPDDLSTEANSDWFSLAKKHTKKGGFSLSIEKEIIKKANYSDEYAQFYIKESVESGRAIDESRTEFWGKDG